MWMSHPQSGICHTMTTEDGTMIAVEIGADVSGSFFAMSEAGDYSGSKGILVDHKLFTIISLIK